MKNKIFSLSTAHKSILLTGAAFLGALGLGFSSSRGDDHVSVQVNAGIGVAVQDEYVYYPRYEMYYNRTRHEYYYREGNAWVHRPEPRRVKAEVLLQAPSVRMDFHDSPERHHDTIIKSYPRDWKEEEHRDRDRDRDRDDRR